MARTWIVAAVWWAGIVWLAYRLADQRAWCDAHCPDLVATRDNVLIWGGSIPLALFVLLALLGRVRIGRLNLRWPTRTPASSRELRPRTPR